MKRASAYLSPAKYHPLVEMTPATILCRHLQEFSRDMSELSVDSPHWMPFTGKLTDLIADLQDNPWIRFDDETICVIDYDLFPVMEAMSICQDMQMSLLHRLTPHPRFPEMCPLNGMNTHRILGDYASSAIPHLRCVSESLRLKSHANVRPIGIPDNLEKHPNQIQQWGGAWLISYHGVPFVIKHCNGLLYLIYLLINKGVTLPTIELYWCGKMVEKCKRKASLVYKSIMSNTLDVDQIIEKNWSYDDAMSLRKYIDIRRNLRDESLFGYRDFMSDNEYASVRLEVAHRHNETCETINRMLLKQDMTDRTNYYNAAASVHEAMRILKLKLQKNQCLNPEQFSRIDSFRRHIDESIIFPRGNCSRPGGRTYGAKTAYTYCPKEDIEWVLD